MIERMQSLKRKMEDLHEEEKILHQNSRKRIQHLQDLYEIPSLADVKYDEWSKIRLNRLLVDYLLRSGYGESARALAREKGIEQLVDLDIFVQCHRIEESLRNRGTHECLKWYSDHKPMMKKMGVSKTRLTSSYSIADSYGDRATLSLNFDYSNSSSYAAVDGFQKREHTPRNI